jgi:hypothetical protein
VRGLALAALVTAAILSGCGGQGDQDGQDGPPNPGPCRYVHEARPHTADEVMNAFRDAGFTVFSMCLYRETTIGAMPEGGAMPQGGGETPVDEAGGVACIVARGPGPPDEREGGIVAGNVACKVPAAWQARVRSILVGLPN